MSECSENIKRYCDMDKFAQSICENMALTEDEANKFIALLWQQQRCVVAEVKHGKWKINSDGYYPYCSECNNEPENGKLTKYCPNCGAKIDIRGEQE